MRTCRRCWPICSWITAAPEPLTLRRGSDGKRMLILEVNAEADPELRADLSISVNLLLPSREPVNLIGDAHSPFPHWRSRLPRNRRRLYPRQSGRHRAAGGAGNGGIGIDWRRALRWICTAAWALFSAFMAANAALVTAVESYPPAANDAEVNLSDFDHIDLIEGGVAPALEELLASHARVDAALVDPPSAGLGADVIALLGKLPLKRLVYVSGDPSLAGAGRPQPAGGGLSTAARPAHRPVAADLLHRQRGDLCALVENVRQRRQQTLKVIRAVVSRGRQAQPAPPPELADRDFDAVIVVESLFSRALYRRPAAE